MSDEKEDVSVGVDMTLTIKFTVNCSELSLQMPDKKPVSVSVTQPGAHHASHVVLKPVSCPPPRPAFRTMAQIAARVDFLGDEMVSLAKNSVEEYKRQGFETELSPD